MEPKSLIELLNQYFCIDKIISNHNLEKLKTIGDSYMCIWVPSESRGHAIRICWPSRYRVYEQSQEKRKCMPLIKNRNSYRASYRGCSGRISLLMMFEVLINTAALIEKGAKDE